MSEITPEFVAKLEARIAEQAQVYMDRPETRPAGFSVHVGGDDIMGRDFLSPHPMLEACLEQAAKDLAPNWDHMMMRFIDAPPVMRLGLYYGEPRR